MLGFITRLFKRKKKLPKYDPEQVQFFIGGKPIQMDYAKKEAATIRQPRRHTSYVAHQHSHDTVADHLMTAAIVHHVYSDPTPSESHCTRSYHEVDTSSSCSYSSSSDSGGSWD